LSERYYRDFNEYLVSCEINIVDSFKEDDKYKEPLSQELVYRQLVVISEFHEKAMGLTGFNAGRLENNTGKKVEQFKVYLKKLKRDLKRFEVNGASNSFEALLLEKAPEYIQRAESCIRRIYDNGYYSLIERSMKRNEVCLGSTYVDNIRKSEQINIRNTKKCCYNMVEFDAIYFFNKLKKKNYKLDYRAAIKEFCKLEDLFEQSELFIAAVLSYPVEFMKYCERYRYGKKEWNEDEYAKRLISAMAKDGNSLL
jgi:hypothetical protein